MYRFPLLHIVGMACTGQQFSIAFVLMSHETQEFYTWALQQLRLIWLEQEIPKVFVTDREMSLVNAIEEEFIPKDIDNGNDIEYIDTAIQNPHQNSVHLLCMWHINKNILG